MDIDYAISFSIFSERLIDYNFFISWLCDFIILDSCVYIVDEIFRNFNIHKEESERNHYIFLYIALSK